MAEVFFDNWTYLKVELNGLERLLLLAVARQRKDLKEVERVAQTKADRATSHWWKGMVSLEGVAYDLPPERRSPTNLEKGSFQQQVQARILASRRQGIFLGLPMMCDRLQLSEFEKNVLLLGLAPEVHRRYGQLYGFLQTGKDCFELPKVDLALRLFCRTDREWREARSQLSDSSSLLEAGLLELLASEPSPLLQRSIQLRDEVVDFLLGESTEEELERVIRGKGAGEKRSKGEVISAKSGIAFEQLVLPEVLMEKLRDLRDRLLLMEQVEQRWGIDEAGIVAVWVGERGTGKTIAVDAIAHSLNEVAKVIDLELLTLSEQEKLLQQSEASRILEIQSAEQWLGRSSAFETAAIAQFLERRRKLKALTVLSLRKQIGIREGLRSRLNSILVFPKPNAEQRSQLWQQALPLQTSGINWQELGQKFVLTGGQIQEKARSAVFFATAENAETIQLHHILKAIEG